MSDSPPWGDTPFSDLNFAADCAVSGRYLAPLLTGLDGPSIATAVDFFRAVAPDSDSFNDSSAVEWHRFVQDSDLDWDYKFDLEPTGELAECRPEICASITRALPNDVVGIGILVAVAIEFLLVIGYCGTALAFYLRKTPPASADGPLARVLHAFFSTTNQFFHLAALLCSGVSIAAIYDGAVSSSDSRPASTYYGTGSLLMGAVYFPLAATIPCYLWASRRQWLDGALLFVPWVLASAAILIVPEGYGRATYAVRVFCPGERVPFAVTNGTAAAVHGFATWCPVLLAVLLLLMLPCFKCSGKRMWEWKPLRFTLRGRVLFQTALRWLIIIYAGLCFIGALSYGIMLLVFAGRTTWVKEAWGLGQGLALVLWLPLLYELVHVVIGMSLFLPHSLVFVWVLMAMQSVLTGDWRCVSRRASVLRGGLIVIRPRRSSTFLARRRKRGRCTVGPAPRLEGSMPVCRRLPGRPLLARCPRRRRESQLRRRWVGAFMFMPYTAQ